MADHDVADVTPRNRRRPKCTVDELEVLVDEMQKNKSTLLGKLSDAQAAQTMKSGRYTVRCNRADIALGVSSYNDIEPRALHGLTHATCHSD